MRAISGKQLEYETSMDRDWRRIIGAVVPEGVHSAEPISTFQALPEIKNSARDLRPSFRPC
jgi:hypothetical protein